MNTTFVAECSAVARNLRARASQAERQRSIPRESIDDLIRTGVFRAFTPQRFGGTDLKLTSIFEGLIELSVGCPSTGWVASLLSIHCFLLRLFNERAQTEIWLNGPNVLVASSVAPSGLATATMDGFLLQGTWSFASGIDHCDWVVLNALTKHPTAPMPGPCLFLVPAKDYVIKDDWDVSGLVATGSKTVELRGETFVPSYRVETLRSITAMSKQSPVSIEIDGMRAIPWQPLFTYGLAPAAIGATIAAVNMFRRAVLTRRSPYSGAAFRNYAPTLIRLAESTAELDSAMLMLRRDIAELEKSGRSGISVSCASIERMLFDVSYIVRSCSQAVDRIFSGSGGRALYRSNLLQMLFRDIHAIAQHASLDFAFAGERLGKFLLDNDDPDSKSVP